MTTITLSHGFKLFIPKIIREKLKMKEGEKYNLIPYNDRLELIKIENIKDLRGLLKGMDSNIDRENDRL